MRRTRTRQKGMIALAFLIVQLLTVSCAVNAGELSGSGASFMADDECLTGYIEGSTSEISDLIDTAENVDMKELGNSSGSADADHMADPERISDAEDLIDVEGTPDAEYLSGVEGTDDAECLIDAGEEEIFELEDPDGTEDICDMDDPADEAQIDEEKVSETGEPEDAALLTEEAQMEEAVPMAADNTMNISGTVRVSTLDSSVGYLFLTGDAELIIDASRDINGISGSNKTLTISGDGSHKLTVHEFSPWSPAQDVAAVDVGTLVMNSGILDAKGQGQGVRAGLVTVNGGKLNSSGYMYGMEVYHLQMNGGELECWGEYVQKRGNEKLIGLLSHGDLNFNGGTATITGKGQGLTDGDTGVGIEVSYGTHYDANRYVAFNGGTVRINAISYKDAIGVTCAYGGSVFVSQGDVKINIDAGNTTISEGISAAYGNVEVDNLESSHPLDIEFASGMTAQSAIKAKDIILNGKVYAGGMIKASENLTVNGGIVVVDSNGGWGMQAGETLTLNGIVEANSKHCCLSGKKIIIGGLVKAACTAENEEAVLCPPVTLHDVLYGYIIFTGGSLDAASPSAAVESRRILADSCFLKVEKPANGKIKDGTVTDFSGMTAASAKIVTQKVSVSIKDGIFYQGDTLELQFSNMPAGGWNTQWQCSDDNETWTDISGETNDYYITGSGDGGKYIRAVVTAKGSWFGKVNTQSKYVNKAVWKVSFSPNGGSGTMPLIQVERGQAFTLPECTFTPPSGKSFVRWDYGKSGTTYTPPCDMTMKAIWVDDYYTLTYESNGGTGTMSPVTVERGGSYTLPENGFTAPVGSMFQCWNVYGADFVPGRVITVYMSGTVKPVWRQAKVAYNANGGTGSMADYTLPEGSGGKFTLPECGFTAPAGKVFDRWDRGAPGTEITISSDITLKALWKTKQYTITFDKNGGSGTMEDLTLTGSLIFTLPECEFIAPEGKTFSMWYVKDAVTSYKLYSPGESVEVTGDTRVQSLWRIKEADSHTAYFDPAEGSGMMASVTLANADEYYLPECRFKAPEGKRFLYWNVQVIRDGSISSSIGYKNPGDKITMNDDYNIRAVWTDIVYVNVSFIMDDHGEDMKPDAQIVDDRECVQEPEDPFEEGWIFEGWYTSRNPSAPLFDFSIPLNKYFISDRKLTLYARWTQKKYSLYLGYEAHGTASLNQGTISGVTESFAGKVVSVSATADEDYMIDKIRYTAGDGEPQDITGPRYFYMPASDVAVSVTFKLKEYDVTIIPDEHGTGTALPSSAAPGRIVTLTAQPDPGYRFVKWEILSGGDLIIGADGRFIIGKENVSVKPVFEAETYEVKFETNGGSALAPLSVKYGETFAKPADPIKADNKFAGWFADSGLKTPYDLTAPVTRPTTLYAKWESTIPAAVIEAETYEVKFETNGGSAIAPLSVKYGETFAKPSDPTKADNKFAGWFADSGLKTPYDLTAPVTGPTILYAKWESTIPTVISGEIRPDAPVLAEIVESTILAQKNDNDLKGSTYSILQLKGVPKSKTSIKLTWKKVPGATGYIIYGNKCGKKNRYEKIKTVTGTSFTQKKLKRGAYYKYLVVAVNGSKALATSKTVHVATKGGKNGNNTKVTIKKGKKKIKKISLEVKKTAKIKTDLAAGKLKVRNHRKTKFESDNPAVATVTAKGKIKAVAKGICYIYAYAQNGVFAKVKVTVK